MSYKLGYARVSTKEQNAEQQISALKHDGCEETFVDVASGAKQDRPELRKLLDRARKGDTVVIWKLDRLARSTKHLIALSDELKQRGIHLRSITDSIDTTTASGVLLFTVLGAIAQFERDVIVERVNVGLERAWASGKVSGRPKAYQGKVAPNLAYALKLLEEGKSISEAARFAKISRSTIYKYRTVDKTPCADLRTGGNLRHDLQTETAAKYANGRSN